MRPHGPQTRQLLIGAPKCGSSYLSDFSGGIHSRHLLKNGFFFRREIGSKKEGKAGKTGTHPKRRTW